MNVSITDLSAQFNRFVTSVNNEPVANYAVTKHLALLAVLLVTALLDRTTTRSFASRTIRIIWLLVGCALGMRASYLLLKRFEFLLQTRVAIGVNAEDAEYLHESISYYHFHLALFAAARLIPLLLRWLCLGPRLRAAVAAVCYALSTVSAILSIYLFLIMMETTYREPMFCAPLAAFTALMTVESLVIAFTSSAATATTTATNKKKSQ
jgi:hypothetical protein